MYAKVNGVSGQVCKALDDERVTAQLLDVRKATVRHGHRCSVRFWNFLSRKSPILLR